MLLTYWTVHLLFTIPPTLVLHLLARPFITRRDWLRLVFLALIAVVWTFPWDAYIIKHKAWTYAPWAVTYTINGVPVEEIFFFVIQSLLTCHLHLLLSLPILPALFVSPFRTNDLSIVRPNSWFFLRWGPVVILLDLARRGWSYALPATHPFYLSCIAFWALPVIAFLWLLGGDYILRRPVFLTLPALIVPTVYLCVVDIVALRAGTWHIEAPTSLGIFVAPDLPLEEAVFFLVTNCLLVCGMSTFEKAYSILDLWPELSFPKHAIAHSGRSPLAKAAFSLRYFVALVRVLVSDRIRLPLSRRSRVKALLSTQDLLSAASKSFFFASFVIPHGGGAGSRADLIVLYAWCRATDNMVDDPQDEEEAKVAVNVCKDFLDLLWGPAKSDASNGQAEGTVEASSPVPHRFPSDHDINRFLGTRVPRESQAPFLLLASLQDQLRLPRYCFDQLLEGYLWDATHSSRPFETEDDLLKYARCVAGSVGEMCVLALRAREGCSIKVDDDDAELGKVLAAARQAGVCLQLVNIARDIREDASRGRCYLPKTWLERPVSNGGANGPTSVAVDDLPMAALALRTLKLAAAHFDGPLFESAIASLPAGCQAGVRAAIVAYLEIGEEVARGARSGTWKGERVSVSAARRMAAVAKEIWRAPAVFGRGPWANRKTMFGFPVAKPEMRRGKLQ